MKKIFFDGEVRFRSGLEFSHIVDKIAKVLNYGEFFESNKWNEFPVKSCLCLGFTLNVAGIPDGGISATGEVIDYYTFFIDDYGDFHPNCRELDITDRLSYIVFQIDGFDPV